MSNKEVLESKDIEEIVTGIIKKNTHLKAIDSRFEYEIYADYRDELSDSNILEISKADEKMECFYQIFEDSAIDSTDHEVDELIRIIKENWDEDEHGDYDEHDEFILEWVQENVDFNFPYDHFLKQEVCVNIIVDTGDGNYDFTLNNFLSYNAREDEEIEDESSILWLVKQQGYTKEHLNNAIKHNDFHNSKLLKSIIQECQNVTTHMNTLSFFVKMTLKEFIDFSDSNNSITLKSNTSCGLYDCWNGAGSVLGIDLERDVVIPAELINAHIDGARGYGVDSIYGMMSSFWTETVAEMR